MTDFIITTKPDGPLVVRGPVTIIDAGGTEHVIPEGRGVGLCRCGGSSRKPFCDATHRTLGFADAEVSPGPTG